MYGGAVMAKRGRKWRVAKDPSHRARVRALVRPYRPTVWVLAGTSFIGGAVEALFLVVVTRVALAIADGRDRVDLVGSHDRPISAAIAIAGALLIIRLGLALVGAWTSASLSYEVLTALRRRLAESFLHSSWAIQHAEPSGQLQNLAGFAGSAQGVISSFATTLSALLNLASLILIAIVVDPFATVVVVGALLVLGATLGPLRRRIRARGTSAAGAAMSYSNALAELGGLGLEMQTYGVRDHFASHIDELSLREGRARRGANAFAGALAPLYTTMAYSALVLGLGVAAWVGAGELSAVGAVMLVMLRSLAYGQQLQTASGNLMSSIPYLERLDETLGRYESNRASGGNRREFEVAPVVADQVSFVYPEGATALQEVSFRIETHEIIGMVGPSGAGKSTLVQLLLGLRDPTSGTIQSGGADLRDIDRLEWSRRVAFVAQDAQLFTGTVAENVRFFRDDIDHATVIEAARQANLLAEIEALPDGFGTFLGERGDRLSGGQRQRLSIARALAGRPELLILDEPTSALDTNSESLIRETMAALRGRTTMVIIAHRLSTLDICDRIMVIEGGRLTAFEQPAVLRERSDFYRRALELSGMT